MESNINKNDIEILQEERIMSFLRGKMSEAEETEFMNDLKKDAELKAKAISIARLAKGISQVGTENDKVLKEALMSSDELAIRDIAEHVTALEQHQESAAIQPPMGKNMAMRFKRKYTTILSMAASILLIVYLGFTYYSYNKTTSLGNQFAMMHETSVARGGENVKAETEISNLINNIHSLDYLTKSCIVTIKMWTCLVHNKELASC